MARTNTILPFLIRKDVYPVSAVVVVPDATVILATCSPLAYNPTWPTTEIKIVYTFIGTATDAGATSVPVMRMVSDPGGAANVRGSKALLAVLGAGLRVDWSWMFRGEAPDSPAFDNGQTLQLQGQNPGGVGNVTFDGFLTLEVFAQQAP